MCSPGRKAHAQRDMKEASSREQAQLGPGSMLGAAWGTQRQNRCGSGVGDGGVSGWEPVISTAVGQSLCLGCPRSAGEQTGARERAVRDSSSRHLCHPGLCLGARAAVVFLCFPTEQSGCPVTSSSAFLLLQQEARWASWVPFLPCSPGRSALSLKHPHPLG